MHGGAIAPERQRRGRPRGQRLDHHGLDPLSGGKIDHRPQIRVVRLGIPDP